MKIKYLQGPKAGRAEHVSNQIGNALVSAGLAENVGDGTIEAAGEAPYRLPKPYESKPVPEEWAVVLIGGIKDNKTLAIQLKMGAAVYHFTGAPQFTNAKRTWNGGERYIYFGRQVPEAIAREYTKQWKSNEALRGPYDPIPGKPRQKTEAEMNNEFHRDELLATQRAAEAGLNLKQIEAELVAFNKSHGA